MALVASAQKLADQIHALLVNRPDMGVWMDDEHGLVIGQYPMPQHIFSFGNEQLAPVATATEPDAAISKNKTRDRVTGIFRFYLLGTTYTYYSNKSLFIGALKLIEEARPGMLARLEKYKPRTKRAVAQKPENLYKYTNLADRFSQELIPGWYVATNNSALEIEKYLKEAARIAELAWSVDVYIG